MRRIDALMQIPDETVRKRAIENTRNEIDPEGIITGYEYLNQEINPFSNVTMSDLLAGCFTFKRTPEGLNYWHSKLIEYKKLKIVYYDSN